MCECSEKGRSLLLCYFVLKFGLMYIIVVYVYIMILVYLCIGICVITLAYIYFYLIFWCVIVDFIMLLFVVDLFCSKDCVVLVMLLLVVVGGIR